jgi:hypothetical protein
VPYRCLDAVAPAGAINSSVSDMLRWLRFHLAGGVVDGKRLISKRALGLMYAPQMSVGDGGEDADFHLESYGLGWTVISYRGRRLVTHSGGIDGYRCRAVLLPDDGLAGVVLTNSATSLPNALTYEAIDRLLGLDPRPWSRRFKATEKRDRQATQNRRRAQRKARVRGTKPSHRLADYKGDYRHPAYGLISVHRGRAGLVMRLNELDGRLEHHHYDVFEFHQSRWPVPMLVAFHADVQGRIKRLTMPLQEGTDDIEFTRDEDDD